MNYIINTLTLFIFCTLAILKVWNLAIYKNYNGILRARWLMLLILVCQIVHTVRFFNNGETMLFMFITAVLSAYFYNGLENLFRK